MPPKTVPVTISDSGSNGGSDDDHEDAGPGRGPTYTDPELLAVAHSWLTASTDPVKSSYRSAAVFWNDVAVIYATKKPASGADRYASRDVKLGIRIYMHQ